MILSISWHILYTVWGITATSLKCYQAIKHITSKSHTNVDAHAFTQRLNVCEHAWWNAAEDAASVHNMRWFCKHRGENEQRSNTSLLYLSIHFSDNFSLLLPTFLHKYLNFLLLAFSKQIHYFILNVFVFLAVLRTFYQPKMLLFDILGMRLNNQLKFNSLCIILKMTSSSVSFAQKCLSVGNLLF